GNGPAEFRQSRHRAGESAIAYAGRQWHFGFAVSRVPAHCSAASRPFYPIFMPRDRERTVSPSSPDVGTASTILAERTPALRVRCWGTRGSLPSPGAGTVRYGGNTSCVEMTGPAGEHLIFDAGSGIRPLGEALARVSPD